MTPNTPGLHHVTGIAGNPERNAEFYVDTLGLRFVKRTVNHDDPGTYHFYFGDYAGTPGTNLTFFPWTDRGRQGRFGAGQTQTTAFLIDPGSVDYWLDRLDSEGVAVERTERFGESVLGFTDPDGIGIEFVAGEAATEATAQPWEDGPVPVEHQPRGFHSVTLAVAECDPTAAVLSEVMGYELVDETEDRRRYRSTPGGAGSVVDLVETDAGRGTMGVGTVHHVAFQARDVAEQSRWQEALADHGLTPTNVIDRAYFQSVYCREPGGVLFEFATTGPGFTADEDLEELGTSLTLPPWLEGDRESITAALPPFEWSSEG